MTIDVTQIIIWLIGVLLIILTRYAVPWIKSHVSTTNLAYLTQAADIAVRAAQELDICGKLSGTKADYALQAVKAALAARKITYDTTEITSAIKAAVANLRLDIISSGADTESKTEPTT